MTIVQILPSHAILQRKFVVYSGTYNAYWKNIYREYSTDSSVPSASIFRYMVVHIRLIQLSYNENERLNGCGSWTFSPADISPAPEYKLELLQIDQSWSGVKLISFFRLVRTIYPSVEMVMNARKEHFLHFLFSKSPTVFPITGTIAPRMRLWIHWTGWMAYSLWAAFVCHQTFVLSVLTNFTEPNCSKWYVEVVRGL